MLLTRVISLSALWAFGCTVDASKTPLHIGCLLPLSEKDGWSRYFGRSALIGAEMAIQDINNRSDVLPNYTLVLHVSDSEHNSKYDMPPAGMARSMEPLLAVAKADMPVAMNKLYEMIYDPPVKVAIFGPMLSSVTEVLGEVVGKWNIYEMSPGSSTPVLSDRSKYPHTYRMVTSAHGFSSAQIYLLRFFGWNRIATLHQTKEPHVGVMNELQSLLSGNQSIISAESFYTDPYKAVERLKRKDVRIIVASFSADAIRKVFCSIYKLDMYGPEYVWIVPGYIADGWWAAEDTEPGTCSKAELKLAIEGYLAITYSFYGLDEEVGLCGKTPQEFRDEIAAEVGYEIEATSGDLFANGYDGIWALALAMDKAEAMLNRSLDSYQYGDEEYALAVGKSTLGLGFAGMSGPLRFSEGGDRIGILLIEQNIDGSEVLVGRYDKITDELEWAIPTEQLWYYSGGEVPFDSDTTKTIELLQATPMPLMATVSVFAAMGMLLAVMFVAFNIWKRQHRQIKMSSPKVNNIIGCGIFLAYLGVLLLGIDRSMVDEKTLLAICTMRSCIIPLAFTLAFGGMFTKMWRVYSIVIANKTKRKVIKDYYLFGIIAVLLVVDFAIFIPWQVIDPLKITENRVPIVQTKEDIENHQRRELLYVICSSNNDTIWNMAMIVYKAFVVVMGAFLAWSTRNIKVSGLNDSYYVGLSIYNTVICCVVAVPLSFLNVSSPVVTFALVSGFLLLCITMSLCMLFVPKVVAVYRKNEVSADESFTGIRMGTTVGAPPPTTRKLGRDIPSTSAAVQSKTTSRP